MLPATHCLLLQLLLSSARFSKISQGHLMLQTHQHSLLEDDSGHPVKGRDGLRPASAEPEPHHIGGAQDKGESAPGCLTRPSSRLLSEAGAADSTCLQVTSVLLTEELGCIESWSGIMDQ